MSESIPIPLPSGTAPEAPPVILDAFGKPWAGARAAPAVDLLAGLRGWPKTFAYLGALGACLGAVLYLAVIVGPKEHSDCMRELREGQREMVGALQENRRATEELAHELRALRAARPEPGAAAQLRNP